MADMRISELATAAGLHDGDLFETSQTDSISSSGYASYKTSLNAIAAFIAKQVQFSDDLQTISKNLIGAINEAAQSGGTQSDWNENDPNELDYIKNKPDVAVIDDFEGQQTASANPITLETKQAGLAKSCVVAFGPIQDLHGYSNPWAGGAGKNKLPLTLATIKSENTSGTWSDNVYTHNSISFTVQTDDGGNVIGISANGTASGGTAVLHLSQFELTSDSYIFNGLSNAGSLNTFRLIFTGAGYTPGHSTVVSVNGNTITPVSGTTYGALIAISSGAQVSNEIFKPMIRLSTVTDATFAPYSNICPISGRTEASVKRTGINQWDEQWEIGTINAVTGLPESDNNRIRSKNYIRVKPSTSYYALPNVQVLGYTADKTFIGVISPSITETVFTTPNNCYYVKFRTPNTYGGTYNNDLGINYPSTDTSYHAYQGETHTKEFGQTVYGGTLDMTSGKLTIDKKYFTFSSASLYGNYGDYNAPLYYCDIQGDSEIYPAVASNNYKLWSNYFVRTMALDDGKLASGEIRTNNTVIPNTPNRFYFRWDGVSISDINSAFGTTPLQVVGEMQTPTTIQLSPEALTLLKGLNVISTDGDKVQVEFSDIPVGDYSVLLDYVKSLETRIEALEA